jgi:hypothetical protein
MKSEQNKKNENKRTKFNPRVNSITASILLAVTFSTLLQNILPTTMATTTALEQQQLHLAYAQEEESKEDGKEDGSEEDNNRNLDDDDQICIPEDLDCDGDDDINPPRQPDDDDQICIPEDLDCDGDDDINPPRQPDDDDNDDSKDDNNNNDENGNDKLGNDFFTAVVRTDDKKYEIDADFDVLAEEENKVFDKNEGAKDVSRLGLTSDEAIDIQLECSSDDCRTNSYTGVSVYLVDIDERDKDIAGENANIIEELADHFCGDSNDQEACDFELTIPGNIDSGKYKLVINAATDELDTFFINKVVMEGNNNN